MNWNNITDFIKSVQEAIEKKKLTQLVFFKILQKRMRY
jgi:hypothetical protein